MFCPHCGKENEEKNKFCIDCGTILAKKVQTGKVTEKIQAPKRKKALVLSLIILFVCGLGITIYKLNNPSLQEKILGKWALPSPQLWDRNFGDGLNDSASDIKNTRDNGYIIVGSKGEDVWVLRLDISGNRVWDKTLGDPSIHEDATSVIQDSDGSYVIAANKGDKVWIIKLDSTGNKLWDYQFGGNGIQRAYSIEKGVDGGYVIGGRTTSKGAGGEDMWIFKIDNSGNLLWDYTYGGPGNDRAYSLQRTSDGGYIVTGYKNQWGGVWVLKLNASGNILWDYTTSENGWQQGIAVRQVAGGGYVIVGGKAGGLGGDDVGILKLDSKGNLIWDKTYGGPDGEQALSFQQTPDEEYLVVGYTYSKGAGNEDGWVLKLDSLGNLIWDNTYGGTKQDAFNAIQLTTDGVYIAAGYTYSNGAGDSDVWVVKFSDPLE